MTIDPMGYDESAFYDGVTVGVGAATAVQDMAESISNCLSELCYSVATATNRHSRYVSSPVLLKYRNTIRQIRGATAALCLFSISPNIHENAPKCVKLVSERTLLLLHYRT